MVYKAQSISLERASQLESKVRVVTQSGERLEFKKIKKEEGVYYGLHSRKDASERILLKPGLVTEVKERNKSLSNILSVGIVGLLIYAVSNISYSVPYKMQL